MQNATNIGRKGFSIQKNELILEFDNFNGLIKGCDKIEDFIKDLKKEVTKFKRWEQYKNQLTSNQLTINNESL